MPRLASALAGAAAAFALSGCNTSYEACRDDAYQGLQQCVRETLRSNIRLSGDLGDCHRKYDRAEDACQALPREHPRGRPPRVER